MNRRTYIYSVSHCERVLGYSFEKGNSYSTAIWHPRSRKRVDCDNELIEKYFGTREVCNVRFKSRFSDPFRETFDIIDDTKVWYNNSIYGDFLTKVPDEIFSLCEKLFEI